MEFGKTTHKAAAFAEATDHPGEVRNAYVKNASLASQADFWLFRSMLCVQHIPYGIYRTENMSIEKIPNGIKLFGERLSAEMMRRRLTQKDLAEAAHCSQAAISRYLNGRIPKAIELFYLSRLLGVSMEWLLCGGPDTGEKKEPVYNQQLIKELEDKLCMTATELRKLLFAIERRKK